MFHPTEEEPAESLIGRLDRRLEHVMFQAHGSAITSRRRRGGAGAARGPRPCAGSRRSSGRRRSGGARRPASRRRGRRSRGVGAAPSRTASVAAARIGVAATEPSATRTSDHPAARPCSRQASAMTTLEIAWARRVPTFRKRTSRPPASGMRTRRMSSSGASAVCAVGDPEVGSPATTRSPRAPPTTISASVASRTGSVSPAGEALAMLPPSVPRFWIWAAPIVAAASTSAGRCSRQSAERRMSV